MNIAAFSNLEIDDSMNVTLYRIASIAPLLLFAISRTRSSNSFDNIQKYLLIFCIILAINILISPLYTGANMYYKVLTLSVYPYIFLLFSYANYHTISYKIWLRLLLFSVIIFGYVYYSIYVQTLFLYDQSSIWVSVYLVALLPLILSTDNKLFRYFCLFIILACVLSNAKRSAFIAVIGAFIVYNIVYSKVSENNNIKSFGKVFLFLLLFSIVFFVYCHYTDSVIIERLLSIKDDGGSGRVDIYDDILNRINQSTFSESIFGHGYLSTMLFASKGRSAHNDFLEVYFDFGALGLIPYALLHLSLILKIFGMIKAKISNAPIMASSYFIFLVFSSTSIVVFNPIFALFTIVWGIGLYNNVNN